MGKAGQDGEGRGGEGKRWWLARVDLFILFIQLYSQQTFTESSVLNTRDFRMTLVQFLPSTCTQCGGGGRIYVKTSNYSSWSKWELIHYWGSFAP